MPKISALNAGVDATPAGTDLVPIVQGGVTKRTTLSLLSNNVLPTGAALTKADDTNVTVALGGSHATGLLRALSIALGWTGQLSIARGGTGVATATAAFDALSPTTTRGDIIRRGVAANERLALGTSGYHLQSDGTDAGWAGFVQAGAGATTRTWQNKARDVVSVKDFGAVGDGSADDTAAIQAAIDSLTSGGRVRFPHGTYKVSSLTVVVDGIALVGESWGGVVINTTSATADVISVAGPGTLHQFELHDIEFGHTVTRTDGAYIHLDTVQTASISCFTMNEPFYGIRLTDSTIITIQRGDIISPVVTDGVGIRIDGTGTSNDHYISDTLIRGNIAAQCRAGVEILNSDGTWLNTVGGLNCGIGLIISALGDTIEHIFSTNCAWDSCENHGMLIQTDATGVVRRVVSTGDWYCSNDDIGIALNGNAANRVLGVTVIGARIYNNAQHGVHVINAIDVSLIGCQIAGNDRTSTGNYDGVNVAANITDFSVHSCRIGGFAGFSATQRYGINIESGTGDNYSILGNDLRSNATGALSDNGSGTTKYVENNLGASDAWTSYTPTVTAGAGTFTTVAGAGTYKQRGRTVFYNVIITITTNGTAATDVRFTLPALGNATANFIGSGRETQTTGDMLSSTVIGSSANARITKYDNTYPGADGHVLNVTGMYTV